MEIKDPEIGIPDINAKDKAGWTALHCASSPGNLFICELLLDYQANPVIPNNDQNIPRELTTIHFNYFLLFYFYSLFVFIVFYIFLMRISLVFFICVLTEN
jgi:hypothetical protein